MADIAFRGRTIPDISSNCCYKHVGAGRAFPSIKARAQWFETVQSHEEMKERNLLAIPLRVCVTGHLPSVTAFFPSHLHTRVYVEGRSPRKGMTSKFLSPSSLHGFVPSRTIV